MNLGNNINVSVGREKRKNATSIKNLQTVRGIIVGVKYFDLEIIDYHKFEPYLSVNLGLNYELKHNFLLNFEVRPTVSVVDGTYFGDYYYFVPSVSLIDQNVLVGVSYRFY